MILQIGTVPDGEPLCYLLWVLIDTAVLGNESNSLLGVARIDRDDKFGQRTFIEGSEQCCVLATEETLGSRYYEGVGVVLGVLGQSGFYKKQKNEKTWELGLEGRDPKTALPTWRNQNMILQIGTLPGVEKISRPKVAKEINKRLVVNFKVVHADG